jgi:hypothetical protein
MRSLKGDNVDSRRGVGANLQMHLCERLGNSEKFVRVTAAVGGQPDLPARSGISSKPASARVRADATRLPTDAHLR